MRNTFNIFGGFLRKIVGGGIEKPIKTIAIISILSIYPISGWALECYEIVAGHADVNKNNLLSMCVVRTSGCIYSPELTACIPKCGENVPGCAYNTISGPDVCSTSEYSTDGQTCTTCTNNFNEKPGYEHKGASYAGGPSSYNYGATNTLGSAEWAAHGVTKEKCPWKIKCPAGTTVAETKAGCEKCDLGYIAPNEQELIFWPDEKNNYCRQCSSYTSNKARTACNSIVIRKKIGEVSGVVSYDELYIHKDGSDTLSNGWFTTTGMTNADGTQPTVNPGYCLGIKLFNKQDYDSKNDKVIATVYKNEIIKASDYENTPILYASVTTDAPCPENHYCPGGQLDPTPCPNNMKTTGTGASSVTDCVIDNETLFCDKHGCFTLPLGDGVQLGHVSTSAK